MNHRHLIPVLTACLACGAAAAADQPAPAEQHASAFDGWSGNLDGFIAGKYLDRDEWTPLEKQGAFGVQFDIQHASWPAALVLNVVGSSATHKEDSTNVKTTGSTGELQFGVREIWASAGHIRFTLAAGFELASASRKVDNGPTTTTDKAGGAGLWASGGVYWTLWHHFNIGPQVTISEAHVTLADQDVRAGGLSIGMIAGYHF